ncbi:DUF494 domain-containing protein [Thiotrichales bacterium 19S3-7]|nr:DUF494 domain-containing protein [Thiotrichales bacterium 19S3-7]MCF6801429.1 DUF494 domain-containing protein [Thiotrichales bacterium 19S3-11]
MNNRNLLDTLMYLFERISQEKDIASSEPAFTTPDEIESGLLEAGYEKNEVSRLIEWLESFNAKEQEDAQSSRLSQCNGFRIYHDRELEKIEPSALSYLLKLEQSGKLKPQAREFILDQIIKLDVSNISLEHVKWILSMTKLNHEGPEQMLEMLIQDVIDSRSHKKDTTMLH